MLTIQIDNVSKSYERTTDRRYFVLDKISLIARAGETVVFRGPNGCGKSTLLNIIAGLTPTSAGTVTANGFPYPSSPVAFVFQNYAASLLPWISVAENITLPLRLNGSNRAERAAALDRAMQTTGFADLPLRRSPTTLSGGQQQKVCIARAIITESPLLLMDEPFSSLDRESKVRTENLIHDLRSEARQILFVVVHDLDDAISLADRIICLDSSPTQVLADVSVPLPRPRPPAIRTDRRFLAIREEVLRASGEV